MQELYDVERSMKEEGVVGAARLEQRQNLVRPLLENLRQKIASIGEAVTPRSALGKAVSYAQGQWLRLLEYLSDVLERISAHPADQMGDLAPRHWRDARARSAVLSPAR